MSTTIKPGDRVFEGHDYGTVRGLFDTALWAVQQGKATTFLAAYREVEPEHADANLGYVIGYGSDDHRKLMYEAFDLTHPALGGRP